MGEESINTKYSFKTGVSKGLLSLLAVAGSIIVFTGFADVSLTDLITKYIFPLISGLTVGGVITVAVNWIKFHTTS